LCEEKIAKKILKWMGFVVTGSVTRRQRLRHVLPTDPAEIAEGERLAHLTADEVQAPVC